MSDFQFSMPTKIVFGERVLLKSGTLVKPFGKKVFFIADPVLHENGKTNPVLESFKDAGLEYEVFNQGTPEPTTDLIQESVEKMETEKCDVVVGMGGGSTMDLSKMTAVMHNYPGTVDNNKKSVNIVPDKMLPIIQIPTTAGTGSEVNHYAIITDSKTGIKTSGGHTHMCAKVAIVDPEITYDIPPQLTGITGVDAICHAIENVMITTANPGSNLWAYAAIKLISENLIPAIEDGKNRESRRNMMLGSMYAGISNEQVGCAGGHVMGIPLSKYFHIQHGITVGIMLPGFMEFVMEKRIGEFARIAEIMGITEKMSNLEKAKSAIQLIRDLFQKAGVPKGLREYGVTHDDIVKMSMEIENHIKNEKNPIHPTREDYIRIYTNSL